MRILKLFAVITALIGFGMPASSPASAFGWDRPDIPSGWGNHRTVRHYSYYPRYHHEYYGHGTTDRYAYRYTPRGYYPYYNSGYYVRPYVRRQHNTLPPFYQAWGAPRRNYRHVEWHNRVYGGHRRGDW